MLNRHENVIAIPATIDEVTAEWLSRFIGTVEAVTATQIGTDFGFGGTAYRLDLIGGTPDPLVAKLSPAGPAEREIAFYERCAGRTPIPLPGYLGGVVDDTNGVVLLEHLDEVRQGDALEGCTRDEGVKLARILATLHATWWGGDDAALAPFRGRITEPRIGEGRLETFLDRHGDRLSPEMVELAQGLPGSAVHEELLSGPLTLTHRDFHLDNVLFGPAGRPYVIDWQGAAVGPPAIDVARLLTECVTAPQRLAFGDEVLAAYSAGVPPTPEPARQIRLALLLELAAVIGWLGTPDPEPPGSRKKALGRNVLHNILAAIRDSGERSASW